MSCNICINEFEVLHFFIYLRNWRFACVNFLQDTQHWYLSSIQVLVGINSACLLFSFQVTHMFTPLSSVILLNHMIYANWIFTLLSIEVQGRQFDLFF